jgi:transcriptional regulator with XRE-family HTH domain
MGKCNTKVEEWTVFGERLNAELKRQNMSYREFAKKAGITLGTVCRYAKSERIPRANEILKTSTALGVTCDYLLGLSDDPHKTSKDEQTRPKAITCKDCYWWTKQEYSLQGRCDRYGMYPTGYWYCAAARERRTDE